MRTIDILTVKEKKELQLLMKESDIARVRTRAHALILSSNGYSIEEISKIYEVDRDTVSSWLSRWEQLSFNGLYDEEKPGRPPEIFSDIKKKLKI
jgi:transposase